MVRGLEHERPVDKRGILQLIGLCLEASTCGYQSPFTCIIVALLATVGNCRLYGLRRKCSIYSDLATSSELRIIDSM